MIQKNPRYEWITKNYDLITKDNIKDIVILRKDGSLNLDWFKFKTSNNEYSYSKKR